ncbi:MAG TPA: hypothetical protein PLW65_34225 [Pseudomonadota bacterium]|nr:hypothetical protein [Pseudomonadota bacterium]
MKQSRATALRKAAGAFLIVHTHELEVLEQLAPWAARLWMLLIRCADYKHGNGETSYAWLSQRMAPVQPARGTRLFAPDAQACKRMVIEFEQHRILARDKRQSSGTQTLFFHIAPRYAQARLQGNLTPILDPPPNAAERATARLVARQG